ncbi:MAG: hypothetical protein ACFFDT_32900, partial [Candidatus Hodarchaeota archaeon]
VDYTAIIETSIEFDRSKGILKKISKERTVNYEDGAEYQETMATTVDVGNGGVIPSVSGWGIIETILVLVVITGVIIIKRRRN